MPFVLSLLARLLLVAALTIASLGCEDEGTPPPGDRSEAPGEGPSPIVPEPAGSGEEARPDEGVDSGEVVIQHRDTVPPAPVPVRSLAGSCDVRAVEPVCFAFTGPGWTAAAAQAECAGAASGVFQSAACPTADRIGECVYRPGGDAARELVHTFYAPMDPLIAEAVCRGTFRTF